MGLGDGDFSAQNTAWGLIVDREFGGCRCADEDEMEFQPDPANYLDNMWACRCLNSDLYLAKPAGKFLCFTATGTPATPLVAVAGPNDTETGTKVACGGAATLVVMNDANGKKCGVTRVCRDDAVAQQRKRWDEETGRSLQTKEAAKVYAKKSMMPENEIARARVLRLKMTKENRMRARVQVAAISMKYRAAKNAMLAGALDKAAFEKAYALVAATIKRYRNEFASRQGAIEDSWNLVLRRQQNAEKYLASDLQNIEEIYEQTLASLADRYGKRIAYYQSLPTVVEITRDLTSSMLNTQTTANCPIWES